MFIAGIISKINLEYYNNVLKHTHTIISVYGLKEVPNKSFLLNRISIILMFNMHI